MRDHPSKSSLARETSPTRNKKKDGVEAWQNCKVSPSNRFLRVRADHVQEHGDEHCKGLKVKFPFVFSFFFSRTDEVQKGDDNWQG